MLADNGDFSEANVKACEAAGVEPLIALGREPIINPCASVLLMCRCRQKTRRQWKRWPTVCRRPRAEALRQAQTYPGAGVRHHQICARIPPFLLRGLEKVKAEGTLVTLAWNMKRMFALKAA